MTEKPYTEEEAVKLTFRTSRFHLPRISAASKGYGVGI